MKVVATMMVSSAWYTTWWTMISEERSWSLGPGARIRYPELAIKKPPRENNLKPITILAFYFSDPFPLFLIRDHFSCKSNKGQVYNSKVQAS